MIKKIIANSIFFKGFIKNAAAVIYTNEDEASNSVRWNERVIFEGNGITSTQIDTVYQDKSISSKPYKFVYLARIDSSHKGTDILLDALFVLKNSKDIVDIDFTFYGKGDVQEELLLQKRISELNFASVSFKGPIYGDEKIQMLNSKDVFVLTSRYEGFPMAVLEALDCGLPCLVTQGVNMSKIIGKYNVGWECQTNANDVAELLLDVINIEPLHLRDMSIAARQFVTDNHSWPSLVKQTEAMFLGVNERTT
ncbi:glycosyltransferase [Shewanella seohaensis]|uniref:glycosyltransferase n=1 Tax=Shewanella seohaensis TaxID=755175 RepID=UPI002905723C|nr:glycosyltransferase [Shewanella seohaensis]